MNGGVGTALVISATSDIGSAIAHTLAEDGCALQLAARCRWRKTRGIRACTGVAVTATGATPSHATPRRGVITCNSLSDKSEGLLVEDSQ